MQKLHIKRGFDPEPPADAVTLTNRPLIPENLCILRSRDQTDTCFFYFGRFYPRSVLTEYEVVYAI